MAIHPSKARKSIVSLGLVRTRAPADGFCALVGTGSGEDEVLGGFTAL